MMIIIIIVIIIIIIIIIIITHSLSSATSDIPTVSINVTVHWLHV
jgi:hypothetical protein